MFKRITSFILIAVFLVSSSLIFSEIALAGAEIISPTEGATVGGIVSINVSYSGTELWPVYFVYTSVAGGYWVWPLSLSGSHTFFWDTTYTPNGTKVTIGAYAAWAGFEYGAYDTVTNCK